MPLAVDGLFISAAREVLVTTALLLATGTTALLVTDLGQIVAVVGSTGATIVSVICPAAAFLLLSRSRVSSSTLPTEEQGTRWREAQPLHMQAAAMLMLGLGLAVLPSSLFCST